MFRDKLRTFFPVAALVLMTLNGCKETTPVACPYTSDQTPRANAGCLITQGDDVLIVTMRLTGKLSIPGGTSEPGESPRCTAFRETQEEAGIAVNVHELLGEMDNGFHVYRCTPQNPDAKPDAADWKEISDVSWRSWLSLDDEHWRFPKQFDRIQQMVQQSITGPGSVDN